MSSVRRVPLVVAIDLEPDDIRSFPEHLDAWTGAEAALAWADEGVHGWPAARIDWFVRADVQTGALMGDRGPFARLGDALRRRLAAGDEVGLHPHLFRQVGGGWRNDYASPAHALASAEAGLAQAAAASFDGRFGLRWGDRAGHSCVHERLAAAGLCFDLTAEPGRLAMPPRDAGRGRSEVVPWHARVPARGSCGLVHWPLSTVHRHSLVSPATGTIAAAPIGSLDLVSDGWIQGWCADATCPAGPPVDIELLVQGRVVHAASADWPRPDLPDAGVASSLHGVRVPLDDRWRTLPLGAFALRARGADAVLPGLPRDLRTDRGEETTIEPLALLGDPHDFARALAHVVATEPVVTVVVRSDAFASSSPHRVALTTNLCQLREASERGEVTHPLGVRAAARLLGPLPCVRCP